MNPAPSKYSIYDAYLINNRIPHYFLLNNFLVQNGIMKGLTKIEQEEGAG